MTGVKELQTGDYVLNNNKPYKVKSKVNVTVGTHCHTKVKLELEGLFDKHVEEIAFSTHMQLEQIDIQRKKGQVIAKLSDRVQVMDLVSYETVDAFADKEMLEQLSVGSEVTFIEYQGKTVVTDKR